MKKSKLIVTVGFPCFFYGLLSNSSAEECKQPVLGSLCSEVVEADCNIRQEPKCGGNFYTEVAENSHTVGHENVQANTECWDSDSKTDTCTESVESNACYYYKEYSCSEREEGSCARAVTEDSAVHYGITISSITQTLEASAEYSEGFSIMESQELKVYRVYMQSDGRVAEWRGDLNVAAR